MAFGEETTGAGGALFITSHQRDLPLTLTLVTWGHLPGVPVSYPLPPSSGLCRESRSRAPAPGAVSLPLVIASHSRCQSVCVDSGPARASPAPACPVVRRGPALPLGSALSASCPRNGLSSSSAAALGAAMCPRGLAPFTGDGFKMKIQCGGASEPSAISLRPRRPACGPAAASGSPCPFAHGVHGRGPGPGPAGLRRLGRAPSANIALRAHQARGQGLCRGKDPVL